MIVFRSDEQNASGFSHQDNALIVLLAFHEFENTRVVLREKRMKLFAVFVASIHGE